MLTTAGYLGHMWKLHSMWTWVPAFLVAAAGAYVSQPAIDLVAFGAIVTGGLSRVWGGVAADRMGRPPVVNFAMTVSGVYCIVVGFPFDGPFVSLALLTWVWGFFVVADSAQFSAIVTEVAPPDSVGTALILQTSAGFPLTMVTIQAVPPMVATVEWRWAFAFLALGPVVGIMNILPLARVQPSSTPAA